MKLVVVGAGDLGGTVAARWVSGGGRAVGITRSEARHDQLRAAGIVPSIQPPATHIERGDLVLLSVSGSEGQREVAELLRGLPAGRGVMTSTTGFHGSDPGARTPNSPPGTSARAQAAARAEATFTRALRQAVIVRLGGLHRPGSGPIAPLLRRGSPAEGPPDRPLALIHRDDAATALLAALTHPSPDPIYVAVVQPLPTREAFYRYACDRHGLADPTFTEPVGGRWTFDTTSTARDLLPNPAHPDWREATAADG